MTAAYRTADGVVGVTTPLTYTNPSSPTAAGDVLYGLYLVQGAETVTVPSGVEVLSTKQDASDTWVLVREVLESGDLGQSRTFTYVDAVFPKAAFAYMVVSGADTTTPEDATPVWTLSTSGTAHAAAGIDTVHTGALVFQLLMERVATANTSFTASAGTIRKQVLNTGSTAPEGVVVDQGTFSAGTARGAATITAGATASTHCGIFTIAVRPQLAVQVVGLTADVDVDDFVAVPSGATQLVDRTDDDTDTTFVESIPNPAGAVFRGSVSEDIDGPPARVLIRSEVAAGAVSGSVTIQLVQVGDDDVVIAERTETGIDGEWADYLLNLTGDEQDAITDYTALDVVLTCSVTG